MQHSVTPAVYQAVKWPQLGGGLDLTLGNVVHRDSQASASKSRSF